jgi:hypothetical protein
VIPTATLLGLSVLSFGISVNLEGIENTGIYPLAMNGVHLMLFICVAWGSLFIYPWMFFRGASPAERVFGSLITPLVFVAKEVIRVREFFTWGEALYYALSPVMLLLLIGQVGLMGIAELLSRAAWTRKPISDRRVVSFGPVAAILAALAALYIFLLWGMGVHWFYIYLQGYKALFL